MRLSFALLGLGFLPFSLAACDPCYTWGTLTLDDMKGIFAIAYDGYDLNKPLTDIVADISNFIVKYKGLAVATRYMRAITAIVGGINQEYKTDSTSFLVKVVSDILKRKKKKGHYLKRDDIVDGLLPSSIPDILDGYLDSSLNSVNNTNLRSPTTSIYPFKDSEDAPYSETESSLRSAIYIPESFSYGSNLKKPVILIPDTGIPAGTTFNFTLSKLPVADASLDMVWVNIPSVSLGDAQVTSEYVAYAINYISGVTNSNVTVVSWSQGSLNTQWALKYWPSTRSVVEDFIPIASGFHGTVDSNYPYWPGDAVALYTPAMVQQESGSNFIRTLLSGGGDSVYVPTTVLYTTSDEIVSPSTSAMLSDAHGAGVTINEIQTVCAGKLAGGNYTHEEILYHPLTWALIIDAINNDGPGDPSRLFLDTVCDTSSTLWLSSDDVLGADGLIPFFLMDALSYGNWSGQEPPIASYAK